jgi:hypothetical protein
LFQFAAFNFGFGDFPQPLQAGDQLAAHHRLLLPNLIISQLVGEDRHIHPSGHLGGQGEQFHSNMHINMHRIPQHHGGLDGGCPGFKFATQWN